MLFFALFNLLYLEEALINLFFGVYDQLLERIELGHLLPVNFVFDEWFQQNELVETVPEIDSINHCTSSSLDLDSTLIDPNCLNLSHLHSILHVSEGLLQLQFSNFIRIFFVFQILGPLDLHPDKLLNCDACVLHFLLDCQLFFSQMLHSWLHHSFIILDLLLYHFFFLL